MLSTSLLLASLQEDYPEFQFTKGKEFRWAPHEKTVYYKEGSKDAASLLHELSHAVLGHKAYVRDIQLIEYEQAAWHHTLTVLSGRYEIKVSSELIEDSLDTYRDWLHARSTCPKCQATGLQVKSQEYSCLACLTKWQVNDARICGLKRTILPKQKYTAI